MGALRTALLDAFRQSISSARASSEVILGLDVSTRAIGLARVSGAGTLLSTDVLTASSDESSFKLAAAVSSLVREHHAAAAITRTVVEEPLKSFTPGRFHTQGLFKLAGLNSVIGYECWRHTQRPVDFFHASSMRAFFRVADVPQAVWDDVRGRTRTLFSEPAVADVFSDGASAQLLRKSRAGDGDVKLAVLRYVTAVFPELAVTWGRTRTGTLAPTCFDRADSILIAMYGAARSRVHDVMSDAVLFRRVAQAVVTGTVGGDMRAPAPSVAVGGARRRRTSAGASSAHTLPPDVHQAVLDAVMRLHAEQAAQEAPHDTNSDAEHEAAEVADAGKPQARPRRARRVAEDDTDEHAAKVIEETVRAFEGTLQDVASPYARLADCAGRAGGMFAGV